MSCDRYALRVPAPQNVRLAVPLPGPAVIVTQTGTPQVSLKVPPRQEHRIHVPAEPVARLAVQERVGPTGPRGPAGAGTQETLFGQINGTQATFTAAFAIQADSEEVSINGLLQEPALHYQVLGNQITFADPPEPGDLLRIRYQPA